MSFPSSFVIPDVIVGKKIYKFVIKKLIEPIIISKKISKYGYKERDRMAPAPSL